MRVSFPNSSCCTPSFSEVSFDWPRRLRTVQRLRMDVAGDGTWSELVAKSFKFALGDRVSSTRDWYYREVESQVVAARLAEEFNARKPPKTVAFILPSVIELVHREGRPLCKKPDFFWLFLFLYFHPGSRNSQCGAAARGELREAQRQCGRGLSVDDAALPAEHPAGLLALQLGQQRPALLRMRHPGSRRLVHRPAGAHA